MSDDDSTTDWPGRARLEAVTRLFLKLDDVDHDLPIEFGDNVFLERTENREPLAEGERSLLQENSFLLECRGVNTHDALGSLHAIFDCLVIGSDADVELSGTMWVDGSSTHTSPRTELPRLTWGHHRDRLSNDAIRFAQRFAPLLRNYRSNERFNRFSNALRLYFNALHVGPDAAIVLFIGALEGLFSQATHELSHRLALAIAWYLEPDHRQRRRQLYSTVKRLYTVRSKVVHGDKIDKDEETAAINLVDHIVPQAENVARRSIRTIVERQQVDFIATTRHLDAFFLRLSLGCPAVDALTAIQSGDV